MISRSAEQCFWLCRHLERITHVARFMSVNYNYILDNTLDNDDQWYPFIIAIGEEQRFRELYGENNTNNTLIQDYIIWEMNNPVSIIQTVNLARENARIIRDIISNELWESINSLWLWITSEKSQKIYLKDKTEFYRIIKNRINIVYGQLYDSTLQDEAYCFMMLGLLLERINQTARIIDIKSYRISLYEISNRESSIETLYWLSILKFFSANEAFLKYNTLIDRQHVAHFLIFEGRFPHAILYCLKNSQIILNRLEEETNYKNYIQSIDYFINEINLLDTKKIIQEGFNDFLTNVVNQVSEICNEIQKKYFEPEISHTKNFKGFLS